MTGGVLFPLLAAVLAVAAVAAWIPTRALPVTPAVATVKPILTGLLVRDGPPVAADYGRLDGWVIRVNWSDLQPTAFGPIAANNEIDQDIATVRSLASQYPQLRLKLRVLAGTSVPDWVKALDGGPVVLSSTPGDTIGHFWASGFASAYTDLQTKLAALYDGAPELLQVEISRCTLRTAEPFLRDSGTTATTTALANAGYTANLDAACQRDEIDEHNVWTTTRSGLALNPYQRVQPGEVPSVDEAFTESMMTYCRSSLGSRCVLANNSIRWPPQANTYPAMYTAMFTNGQPLAFQTAAPDRIGDWYQTLNSFTQRGANSIELNRDYPSYDATQLEAVRQVLRCSVTCRPTPFVTSFSTTTLRNNFGGWVGYRVVVGSANVTVSSLGRMVAPGNVSQHVVKLVTASTGADVPGASVVVDPLATPAGSFVNSILRTPVTLAANTSYYLVSSETAGGDQWYDYQTNLVTTSVGSVPGPVWASSSSPTSWNPSAAANQGFVPVSFLYGGTAPPPPPTTTSFVTSFSPTTLRNNFSGFVGYKVTVGSTAVSVTSLGRWVVAGNTGSHVVKLVTASTGANVTGGSVTVSTSGKPAGAFAYAALPSAVTLAANTSYYVVSQEVTGGDRWYDYTTNLVTTSVGSVPGPVWASSSSPTSWNPSAAANQGFVPVSFLYGGTAPPPPPTTTSFVTSFSPTTLRNNFSGFVGYKVTVGPTAVSVTSLGRWVVAGNTGSHVVKLVTASTGANVTGGSVTVSTSGKPAGAFAYAALPSAVTLAANTSYYVVSQEVTGGDRWYDYTTNLVTTSVGSVPGPVWASSSSPTSWNPSAAANQGFVPVSFLYA